MKISKLLLSLYIGLTLVLTPLYIQVGVTHADSEIHTSKCHSLKADKNQYLAFGAFEDLDSDCCCIISVAISTLAKNITLSDFGSINAKSPQWIESRFNSQDQFVPQDISINSHPPNVVIRTAKSFYSLTKRIRA